ncbi:MAG: hypothetical protein QXS20_10500 [Candidatus Thorarchaeota archaeon]
MKVHSIEYSSLEDLLIYKHDFALVEEATHTLSRGQPGPGDAVDQKTASAIVSDEIIKYSSHKKLSGMYMDAKITVDIMGEVIARHTVLKIAPDENQSTYTVEYQTVNFMSDSGYAIQKLIEELEMTCGLSAEKQEWGFHRLQTA